MTASVRLALTVTACVSAIAAQPIRVGAFDRASIVVAYYRSPMWAEVLNAKIAERDAAKKANDTARVAELEAWGQAHQDLAHRQLAGEAPIDDILKALEPAFAAIAARAGVEKIVAEKPPGVETVDVTPLLLDWLKADAKTREIIGHLPKQR